MRGLLVNIAPVIDFVYKKDIFFFVIIQELDRPVMKPDTHPFTQSVMSVKSSFL